MAKLYFRYGTMGSGKSIDLLKVAYNYEERNQKCLLMVPSIDNRYGVGKVTTRIGISREAYIINEDTNIYEYVSSLLEKPNCILVDECNFLTKKHVNELSDVVDNFDIPVLCYGLRADAFGHVFPGSLRLFEIADKIEEMKAICKCGNKATFNLRLNKINEEYIPVFEGEQIAIAGSDSEYDSVCRRCYKKLRKEYGKKEEK